jgi:hypothetical protein
MGWIGCLVVASEREPGYLDSCPPYRPERAEALMQALYGEGRYRTAGPTSFDGVLYPRHGHVGVGAYDGAAVVTDASLFDTGPTGGPLAERMLDLYPRGRVLVVRLAESVNLWSYAYFERGTMLRLYGGDADRGVQVDEGPMLAEERPFYASSLVRRGRRTFLVAGDEYAPDQMGESMTCAVARRLLGRPLDAFMERGLAMEEYAPVVVDITRRSFWRIGGAHRSGHARLNPTTG